MEDRQYPRKQSILLYAYDSHGGWFLTKGETSKKVNPNTQEAVKAEVKKVLDAGVIYLISDSS